MAYAEPQPIKINRLTGISHEHSNGRTVAGEFRGNVYLTSVEKDEWGYTQYTLVAHQNVRTGEIARLTIGNEPAPIYDRLMARK